jgi:general secretion pathway protein N
VSQYRVLICLAMAFAAALPRGVFAEPANAEVFGNPLWTIPLSEMTATRDRPLFDPSRRRPNPPAIATIAHVPPPPPPPQEPEQPPLALLGTIAAREGGFAICLNQATSELVRIRTGETFEGWTLLSVRGREATFETASRQVVLALPSPDDPRLPARPQIAGAQRVPVSPPNAVAAAPPSAMSGTWRDGDGNLIAAPPKAN